MLLFLSYITEYYSGLGTSSKILQQEFHSYVDTCSTMLLQSVRQASNKIGEIFSFEQMI